MATNTVFERGTRIPLVATDPAIPASGDPLICGLLPGVALAAEGADGITPSDTGGVYNLSVKGIDGGGNSVVAAGDLIYYVSADTPKLSKKATGVRFGYALGAVLTGATTTIPVKVGY